jgi:predicted Zn-dependent peptidase
MFRSQIITGPKGLKILTLDNPNNLSTTFLILVNVGSDWENKKNNGIFHFIEHLYFKGTKKYPNSKILMETIDSLGGNFNAFTSCEYTGYYIKVLPEYSFSALEILSEIILNPLFDEQEIEKEKNVIFEEINMIKDRPHEYVLEVGNYITFGDQPAGWPIIGNKETIAKITREDILKTVNQYYSTRNTLVVVSGKLNNKKKLIEYILKIFKNYNSQKINPKPKFKSPLDKYKEKIVFKDTTEAHLFLGFPLPGLFKLNKKRLILFLLSIILGGKTSSRLWIKIREELGAAYYIRSYFSEHSDRSLFFIHAALNLDRLETIFTEIIKEIALFKKTGPQEKELETSKAILKSNLFMDLEESLSTAIFYGRQLLLEKKIKTPDQISKEIAQIQINDFKNVNNIFNFNKAKLALILPEKYKINFSKIIKKILI